MENNLLNLIVKKESLTRLKQKEIFEELPSKRIDEIQTLSQQIYFNSLTYYFKCESAPKNFIIFKGALGFYKNVKDGYITLEKGEEKQKESKSGLNEILKGRSKSGKKKKI